MTQNKATSDPLVDMLVQAGMSVDEAKGKVEKGRAALKAKGYSDADVDKELHIQVIKVAAVYKSVSEVVGVVLGFSKLRDSNDYERRKALDLYKTAPDEAIAQHKVEIISGKAEALDQRQFLDSENTQPNGNYLKPLPVIMQRTILALVDDNGAQRLQTIWGKVNVEIGTKYKFLGSLSKKGNLSLSNSVPPIPLGKMNTNELYAAVDKYYQSAQEAFTLGDAIKQPKKPATFVLTKGFIVSADESRNGGSNVVISGDDTQQGIRVFFDAPEATDYIVDTPRGTDVFIFGRVTEMLDKRNPSNPPQTIMNGMGLIKSAETSALESRAASSNEELDSIFWD